MNNSRDGSTYRISRHEDGEMAVLMIQHTPHDGPNQDPQSDTHPREAHGGSDSGLASSIGQDGHTDRMHASGRGSLDQPPDEEERFRPSEGKSQGGSGEGDEAPEVRASTGIATVCEPARDRLRCVNGRLKSEGPMLGAMEVKKAKKKKQRKNLRDPTRSPAPYAASKIPIHR